MGYNASVWEYVQLLTTLLYSFCTSIFKGPCVTFYFDGKQHSYIKFALPPKYKMEDGLVLLMTPLGLRMNFSATKVTSDYQNNINGMVEWNHKDPTRIHIPRKRKAKQ